MRGDSEPEPQPAPPPQYYAPPPVAAQSKPPYINELEQLAQMHADGILGVEEYEAKKRQILGI
jgi:hypothetical protein